MSYNVKTKIGSQEKKSLFGIGKISNGYIELLMLISISLFLIITPFYRGLYFRQDYILSVSVASVIFVSYFLYKLHKKEYGFIESWLDVVLITLPILYLISFFFAVNSKDAYDAVLKYYAGFMVYKVIAGASKDRGTKEVLLNIVFSVAVIVAVTGILGAVGIVDIKGVVLGNRINGLYQYPNTTATVLGSGFLLGLGLLAGAKHKGMTLFYQSGLVSIMTVLVLTLSRGTFLILAVLLFAMVLILKNGKKIDFIINMIIVTVISAFPVITYYEYKGIFLLSLLLSMVMSFVAQIQYRKSLRERILGARGASGRISLCVLILVAMIGIVIFTFKEPLKIELKPGMNTTVSLQNTARNSEYYLNYELNDENDYKNIGIIASSVNDKGERIEISRSMGNSTDNEGRYTIKTLDNTQSLAISIYNISKDKAIVLDQIKFLDTKQKTVKEYQQFKFLPSDISNRLSDFSLGSSNNDARIVFAKDSLKLFKDYFLVGAGGGAWQNLYLKYQSYPYFTRETHNHYMQMLTEVGILGIIFLAVFAFTLFSSIMKAIKEENILGIYIYSAILLLGLHAAIDFDLSLLAVLYYLFALLALAGGTEEKNTIPKLRYLDKVMPIALISGVIVLYFSTSSYFGMVNGNKASSIIYTDPAKAEVLYNKAITQDKFNTAYRVDYIQMIFQRFKETRSQADLDLLNEHIHAIREYEPYNAAYMNVIMGLMIQSGRFEESIKLSEEFINIQPLNINAYSSYVNVNYSIASYFFGEKKYVEALPYLNNMIKVKMLLKKANEISKRNIPVPSKLDKMINIAQDWKAFAEKKVNKK